MKKISALNDFVGEIKVKIKNPNFLKVIQGFLYLFIPQTPDFDINLIHSVFQEITEQDFIVINQNNIFYIIIVKEIIIIIDKSLKHILNQFFIKNSRILYFLSKAEDDFKQSFIIDDSKLGCDESFKEEILSLKNIIQLCDIDHSIDFFEKNKNFVLATISSYLIIRGYIRCNKMQSFRISTFDDDKLPVNKTFDEDEFIELKKLGSTQFSSVALVYLIENGNFYAVKKLTGYQNESPKLMEREIENYLSTQKDEHEKYILLPRFYGQVRNLNHLVIQFINGKTLENIEELKLNFEEKITIIFELMMTINYFHKKGLVYRDLKPNNIIVDENKNAFIIDFDRMVKQSKYSINENHTCSFNTVFVAPDVLEGKFSLKSDIYSIGQMIYYIINEDAPQQEIEYNIQREYFFNDLSLLSIYKKCVSNDDQISISDLMFEFFYKYQPNLNKDIISNDLDIKFFSGIINHDRKYIFQDINKTIHYIFLAANLDDAKAQSILGYFYLCGKYLKQDIQKSIHYLTLAANKGDSQAQYNLGAIFLTGECIEVDIVKSFFYFNNAASQNHSSAQYHLGLFYLNGYCVKQDIDKAFHYFFLAANQNCVLAQYDLGYIFYNGEYIERDINKAIHYFSLISDQQYIYYHEYNNNDMLIEGDDYDLPKLICQMAQINLGDIFYDGKYVKQDINKAIHFYKLAANQKNKQANFILGLIYYEGKYVKLDINKGIYYLIFAANQDHVYAQYNLGIIYSDPTLDVYDINKAIYYFTMAANQNHKDSQKCIAEIYCHAKYIERNINKAIYYFSLAANQNDSQAQHNLGIIYYDGKYIDRDINKAIFYFSLAANQNNPLSLYVLGKIYYDGIYIQQDINKASQYFSHALKQNNSLVLFNIGMIYYEGKYIAKDIDEAIYCYSQITEKNYTDDEDILYDINIITKDTDIKNDYSIFSPNMIFPYAQYNLGIIYYKEKIDIDKAIHYFTLAANQNIIFANNYLAEIYYQGIYIERDINKTIYYLTIAANHNDYQAQYNLGIIYFEGKYIKQDINKAIHYFKLAFIEDQNAQYTLGMMYSCGQFVKRNMIKSFNLFVQSASNRNIQANFVVGYFYHEGIYITRNINKSIKYYKDASSFNNQYAKNNIGIIYKNGIGKEIKQNIGLAMAYFDEAIRRMNDKLSLYNLSHIYIYEENNNQRIDEAIDYLIKSSLQGFSPANDLLCIALIKKYGFNLNIIQKELQKLKNFPNDKLFRMILQMDFYEKQYQYYKSIDFLYDFKLTEIQSKDLNNQYKIQQLFKKRKDITLDFYEGFGNDFL